MFRTFAQDFFPQKGRGNMAKKKTAGESAVQKAAATPGKSAVQNMSENAAEFMEDEIFDGLVPDPQKLRAFGFQESGEGWRCSRFFLDDAFRADILIRPDCTVRGTVFDMDAEEEYAPLRAASRSGAFVSEVRETYRAILEEIADRCCSGTAFRPARDAAFWITPANPKYYDVDAAFRRSPELTWRQHRDIRPGDYVFIYMGAPVSAIRYLCRVLEADLPREGRNKNGSPKKAVLLHMEKEYAPEEFPLKRLRTLGVTTVRDQRSAPPELLKEILRN